MAARPISAASPVRTQGLIADSHATGNVGTLNVANLQVGGLVSDNTGTINNSYATGNVRAGDNSAAGGLTSNNGSGTISPAAAAALPAMASALLQHRLIYNNSYATGNVTVGNASVAGGLVGI